MTTGRRVVMLLVAAIVVIVLGIWLVALGVIEIALAFQLRSLGGPPGPLAPA